MQIAVAVITLILCGAVLWWFNRAQKKSKTQSEDERELAAQKTAQDFVNVKDVTEHCLWTNDGLVFSYVKIEGLCLELYSKQERKRLCHDITITLSGIRYPYKFISVSRPVDVSKALQKYQELYANAEGGRRQLLKNEMQELTAMVISGETLERQHYLAIWNNVKKEDEADIVRRAKELSDKLNESGLHTSVIDRKDIVRLCNLVNIPAYVHIESSDVDDTMSVLSGR